MDALFQAGVEHADDDGGAPARKRVRSGARPAAAAVRLRTAVEVACSALLEAASSSSSSSRAVAAASRALLEAGRWRHTCAATPFPSVLCVFDRADLATDAGTGLPTAVLSFDAALKVLACERDRLHVPHCDLRAAIADFTKRPWSDIELLLLGQAQLVSRAMDAVASDVFRRAGTERRRYIAWFLLARVYAWNACTARSRGPDPHGCGPSFAAHARKRTADLHGRCGRVLPLAPHFGRGCPFADDFLCVVLLHAHSLTFAAHCSWPVCLVLPRTTPANAFCMLLACSKNTQGATALGVLM